MNISNKSQYRFKKLEWQQFHPTSVNYYSSNHPFTSFAIRDFGGGGYGCYQGDPSDHPEWEKYLSGGNLELAKEECQKYWEEKILSVFEEI